MNWRAGDPAAAVTMTERLRALIVEDYPDDALLIVRELKRNFSEVEFLRVDTREALREALNNPWDVILCDYLVPDLPWPVALREAQNRMCNVPFIVVSGLVGEDDAGLAAIRDGAWEVLSKSHIKRLGHIVKRELVRAEALSANSLAQAQLIESAKGLQARP